MGNRTWPAAEDALRQIVDNSSAVIFIKDLEGRYRLVNPAFERLFHIAADQVIGRDDHQLFPAEIADALKCNDLQVIRLGRSIEVEERVFWRDRPYTYLTTKFPIGDAGGQVVGVGGIATDISERKRTEEALRHVALGVSRATGYEVFPATVRYLASSLQVDLAFVSRAARPDSTELSTLATWYRGEPVGNFDYPLLGTPCAEVFGGSFRYIPRHLGELYPLDDQLKHLHIDSYAGFPLFASDGRPLGLIAVGHGGELPERERVESVLRIFSVRVAAEMERADAETSYRSIFESSDAIFVHDLDDGRLVDVNPAACAIYGYTREQMLGLKVGALGSGEPPYTDEDARRWLVRARDEGPQRFEWLRRNRDGSLHWDEVHLRRASIVGTERILAFTRDITERKAAEQQRAVLEQQLRQAQRMEAIGHLTGGIAHDFNNLLTSMLGYTQMAEELAAQRNDEALERYLGRIRQSGEKARDLIRQMLVFSRGSRGQPRPVLLAALVEEFRPLLQSALPAGIELDLQLGAGLRPVRVDPLQLEQVLMNLCINARDAMAGSGRLAIRLGRRSLGDELCASCLQPVSGPFQVLSVEDTGPGIDERVQRTIFEPFYTTKPPGQGSGMGLSMVHGLVHEYGGHLLLNSRPGQGARFDVLLPEMDAATRVAVPRVEGGGTAVGKLHGRVGVVDDDPLVCEFLTDCLRQWGLEVSAWSDAEQARTALLASIRDWDALILDQTMPRLCGLSLAEQLLAARPGLPIALHTGFSSPEDERTARHLGLSLLHKPLDASALHDWLGSRLHA